MDLFLSRKFTILLLEVSGTLRSFYSVCYIITDLSYTQITWRSIIKMGREGNKGR
jgi:hypothetical protein